MMDNHAAAVLASLAVSRLRDLANAMPDHPAVPLLVVYIGQIEGAVEANDADYVGTLLGLERDA
jgi:hypothetical protein